MNKYKYSDTAIMPCIIFGFSLNEVKISVPFVVGEATFLKYWAKKITAETEICKDTEMNV